MTWTVLRKSETKMAVSVKSVLVLRFSSIWKVAKVEIIIISLVSKAGSLKWRRISPRLNVVRNINLAGYRPPISHSTCVQLCQAQLSWMFSHVFVYLNFRLFVQRGKTLRTFQLCETFVERIHRVSGERNCTNETATNICPFARDDGHQRRWFALHCTHATKRKWSGLSVRQRFSVTRPATV